MGINTRLICLLVPIFTGQLSEVKRCNQEGLVAINSKLAWIFSYPVISQKTSSSVVNVTHVMNIEVEVDKDCQLNEKIEKFWDLDSVGVVEKEQSVYDKFIKEITLKDNRYEVRLPFKEGHPLIEDNCVLSCNRLKSLSRKLRKTPDILKEYGDVIRNQMELGIIEEVTEIAEMGEVTYLPHRAVIREDKQITKLRVVFDASAKNVGPSLNDCMYKGPCLIPLLYDMLLRFRINNVAIVADIKQAFLQISVAPKDRDYLRFLWWQDAFDDKSEVVKYRFNRFSCYVHPIST